MYRSSFVLTCNYNKNSGSKSRNNYVNYVNVERRKLTVFALVGIICSLCQGSEGQTNLLEQSNILSIQYVPLQISPVDLRLKVGDNASVIISPTSDFNITLKNVTHAVLNFVSSRNGIIDINPNNIAIIRDDSSRNFENTTLFIDALSPGRVTVKSIFKIEPNNTLISSDNIFLRISIHKYVLLITVSEVIGWIYFVAWSISFYPQIYQNWRRKSVRGLSLDFVYLNFTGFFVYGMFNVGLYAIPSIQQEYISRYPTGQIPVQINDVFFTIHAIFASAVTGLQCIFYDKGAQTISKTGKTILFSIFAVVFVLLVVTVSKAILWLDFLIACSTIKLIITLIKYMPQAYLNYARKSTSGWCIGNVLLDLTGGIFSVLQMMILAFNNDDWVSLFGDYTKFGLGAFSILFDIFFIIQHYVLYKSHEAYEPIEGTTLPGVTDNQEDITTSNHLQTTESEGDPSVTLANNNP